MLILIFLENILVKICVNLVIIGLVYIIVLSRVNHLIVDIVCHVFYLKMYLNMVVIALWGMVLMIEKTHKDCYRMLLMLIVLILIVWKWVIIS